MILKETTWIAMLAIVGATVLAGMRIIDSEAWMWVCGVAVGGKSLQGFADRWGAHSVLANPTKNPGQ